MSFYQPIDARCHCGHTFTAKTAQSVNASRTPEIRHDIVAGTFHTARCPSCGATSVLERKFLYCDFDRNTIFLVQPRDARHLWEDASVELDGTLSKVPVDVSRTQDRHCRVVFGLGELREKLIAQDAGLDDRLVELSKVFVVYDHPFLLRTPRLRILLHSIDTDRVTYLAFHDHETESFEVRMPRSVFDEVVDPRIAEEWVTNAHKNSNIFRLDHDHWVNIWRWSPQSPALRDLDRYSRLIQQGKQIDFEETAFRRMLKRLPDGSHLPGWAKRALRVIYDHAKSRGATAVMDEVFEIRFDTRLDDEWGMNNNPDDIDTLWDLLAALPDANVEGNTFISNIELVLGGGGYYSPHDREIAIGADNLPHKEPFQDVVRHEVGHAVQEKRDRKEHRLVTKWLSSEFGWATFGSSTRAIDNWVRAMGGYGSMSQRQKTQIRQLLRQCLGPGGRWHPPTIPETPQTHPWRKPDFGPRLAFERTGPYWYRNYLTWYRFGGKAFFINFWYAQFMVVDDSALQLVAKLPSDYAAMSPFEFFAELYALYYDLDDPLRKNIPSSIADWFSAHIGHAALPA